MTKELYAVIKCTNPKGFLGVFEKLDLADRFAEISGMGADPVETLSLDEAVEKIRNNAFDQGHQQATKNFVNNFSIQAK